jgi:hypothetical protein
MQIKESLFAQAMQILTSDVLLILEVGTLLKIKWAWPLDWGRPMALKLNKRGFSPLMVL